MFVYFALLCPGMLLIAWTAIMLTEKRSTTNNLLTVTLALCAIHILAEGIYLSPTAKVSHIALVNIVRQIFGPIVLPFIAMYVRALCGKKIINWLTPIWFILVTSQSIATILFMILMGEHHANEYVYALRTGQGLEHFAGPIYSYYKTICMEWYDILLLIQTAYITIAAIVLHRKSHYSLLDIKEVWKGQSARIIAFVAPAIVLLMIVCGIKRLYGDQYLIEHPAVTAAIMFSITLIAHAICYTCHMKRTDPNESALEEEDHLAPSTDQSDNVPFKPSNAQYHQMCQRLDKLIEQDRVYLYATITLESMARKMNTSKTSLAWLIKQRHNMRFREFINRHRVEYAKTILMEKPEALLEYIASQSGYLSTSAFSKNFMQYVGMPPRLWSMNQHYKDNRGQEN